MDAGYCGRRSLTARGRPVLCLAMGAVVLACCGCGEEVVPDPWGVTPATLVEPDLGVFPNFTVVGEGFALPVMVSISPDGVTWTPCSTTFVSTTELDFRPAVLPAGTYSVKIDNGTGEEWTLTDAFTALPRPRITSVAPDFGPAAGGTLVTVTGEGFTDTCVVLFGFVSLDPLTELTVVDAQTITGRTPPYVYAIPEGNIAGTPAAAAATQTFTVEATDGAATVSRAFTIEVVELRVHPAELPAALEGASYFEVLTVWGGAAPYSWSVKGGSSLPAGLALSAGGVLSGTPTDATGSPFTFTLIVTDSSTPLARSQEWTYTMDVLTGGPYIFGGTFDSGSGRYFLPDAAEGSPYAYSLPVLGGTSPYTFTVTAGTVPAWLTLDSGTGYLSGNAPPGGTEHDFTVTVTDSLTATASRDYRLHVVGAGSALRISTESLSAAVVGEAYEVLVEAVGGDQGNLSTSITAGVLPDGLHLNAALVPYWVEDTVAGTYCLEGPWVGFAYTAP